MGSRTKLKTHSTNPASLGPSPLQSGYVIGPLCAIKAQAALSHQTWVLERWVMERLDGPGHPTSPLVVVACSSLEPSLLTEARCHVEEV